MKATHVDTAGNLLSGEAAAPLYHKTLSGEYDQEWRKDIYFIGEKVECRS